MITHSARSAILGCLFELAGLKKHEDATQELKHHRIQRDHSDTRKLVSGIENTLNPFDETYQDENLFCLSTGKATSKIVKTELLHIIKTGRKECEQFKEECFVDPTRFDKAIKRRKIRIFSSDAVKVTIA